jgi:hypothetical protein
MQELQAKDVLYLNLLRERRVIMVGMLLTEILQGIKSKVD